MEDPMTTYRKYTVLLLMFLVTLAHGQVQQRPMTLEDIFALKSVSDPQLSPDGRWVAYVVTEVDLKAGETNSDIWLIPASGGEAIRLTTSKKNDSSPRWSPDGKRIAFLSTREEKTQIYLMSPFGGEAEKLTNHKTSPSALEWSPDGKKLLFTAPDPPTEEEEKKKKEKDDAFRFDQEFKMTHLWVVDVSSKTSTQLTRGTDYTVSQPRWSPDGTRIVFVTNPTPRADDGSITDIWVYSFADSTAKKLTTNDGPDTAPVWSPDGGTIAYLSRPGNLVSVGNQHLHLIPASGGMPRNISAHFDASISAMRWSPDGSRIYFVSAQSVTSHLYSIDVKTGKVAQHTAGAFVLSSPSFSRDGRWVAYIQQNERQTPEVFVASTSSWKSTRLTNTNALFDSLKLGTADVIRWTSYDGLEIEGLVLYPADYQRGKQYPLLVYGHGGPTSAYTRTFPASWSNLGQFYASNGWVVFYPNFRGSTNYGEKFMQANINDWGNGDYRDIMTGVDELIRRGIADPNRMAYAGWSYGGYLANWIVSQTDRFKAISCGAGLSNMYSMYSTNDLQRVLETFFGGTVWENPEEYDKRSGIRFIKNARTPTIIFHGQEDRRVPLSQGQELYMGLKKHNVPVDFVVFPRQGHGITEPKLQYDKMKREYAWFSKYVLGVEATQSATQPNPKD
jgi:dipeptidyl aminopeptidase/acylaminoacyl peptidase